MSAVFCTAIAFAVVGAILMRLCALPTAKVIKPKRRVLLKVWEGLRSFMTKVRGPRGARALPLHVTETARPLRRRSRGASTRWRP